MPSVVDLPGRPRIGGGKSPGIAQIQGPSSLEPAFREEPVGRGPGERRTGRYTPPRELSPEDRARFEERRRDLIDQLPDRIREQPFRGGPYPPARIMRPIPPAQRFKALVDGGMSTLEAGMAISNPERFRDRQLAQKIQDDPALLQNILDQQRRRQQFDLRRPQFDPRRNRMFELLRGRATGGNVQRAAEGAVVPSDPIDIEPIRERVSKTIFDSLPGEGTGLFDPLGGSAFDPAQGNILRRFNQRRLNQQSATQAGLFDALLSANKVDPEDFRRFQDTSLRGFAPVSQGSFGRFAGVIG